MRILFDFQAFSYQNMGGVSRYIAELCKSLNRFSDVETEIIAKFSNNPFLNSISSGHRSFLPNQDFRGKSILMDFTNTFFAKRMLKKADYDIFHPTYFYPYHLAINSKPFVLTIHDLTAENFPDAFNKYDRYFLEKRKEVVKRASGIIAVSENTKQEFLNYYEYPEEKVKVVYHGTQKPSNSEGQFTPIPFRYLLYVGKRGSYKNFLWMINPLQDVLKSEEVKLVCIGGGALSLREKAEISKMGLSDYVIQKEASDPELANYYKNAEGLLISSKSEGFGLPILEAMQYGCPVILPRWSCFPEVAGTFGFYFNGDSQEDFADVVKNTLLEGREKLKDQHMEFQEWLDGFSWETAAKRTKDFYHKIIEQHEN